LCSHFESRTKKTFGEAPINYKYNGSDVEPKSMEYQPSDYRSSPENQRMESSHRSRYTNETNQLNKDKSIYRSTPEIHHRTNEPFGTSSYNSLPREDHFESGTAQRFRSERFLNREESDRRTDRLVDSGIENDFRRDSSENYQSSSRPVRIRRDLYNESEDEGWLALFLL